MALEGSISGGDQALLNRLVAAFFVSAFNFGMKVLCVAEKPSLAKSITQIIAEPGTRNNVTVLLGRI